MLDIVLTIFAVIALGWLARHFGILAQGSQKPLNDYIYYVSMPALILVRLMATKIGGEQVALLMANALPVLAMVALVLALARLKILQPKLAGALLITSFFGNIIFMGFPAVQLRFGPAALGDAAIITFIVNFLIFTLGLASLGFISGKSWFKFAQEKLARNTIIASCIIGAAVSLAGLVPPAWLSGLLDFVGSTTSPLALFSMGVFLYGQPLGSRSKEVALLAIFKLAIFPLLVVVSLLIFGLRGTPAGISFMEALMPLAVTNFIIAEKFDLDGELVAEAIVTTTLLSIPLILGFDSIYAIIFGA